MVWRLKRVVEDARNPRGCDGWEGKNRMHACRTNWIQLFPVEKSPGCWLGLRWDGQNHNIHNIPWTAGWITWLAFFFKNQSRALQGNVHVVLTPSLVSCIQIPNSKYGERTLVGRCPCPCIHDKLIWKTFYGYFDYISGGGYLVFFTSRSCSLPSGWCFQVHGVGWWHTCHI